MAEVVLFHHVQGLTDGVRAFAEQLRAGGHIVHTPDLFDGERAATVEDGIALVGRIGEETIDARVNEIVAGLETTQAAFGRSETVPVGRTKRW